jgi:hypothetical protein
MDVLPGNCPERQKLEKEARAIIRKGAEAPK